jgi:hypothetical protein
VIPARISSEFKLQLVPLMALALKSNLKVELQTFSSFVACSSIFAIPPFSWLAKSIPVPYT